MGDWEFNRSRIWQIPVRRPGDIVAKIPEPRKIKQPTLFDPEAFLKAEGVGRTMLRCKKSPTVFYQDDASDSVFYVIKGKVKIIVLSEQGKEAVIAIVGPDEFFGEGCLTGQLRRLSTASAMTECEIMRIGKSAMLAALRKETKLSEMFVAHVLEMTASQRR